MAARYLGQRDSNERAYLHSMSELRPGVASKQAQSFNLQATERALVGLIARGGQPTVNTALD
jgi:hypothetical protein